MVQNEGPGWRIARDPSKKIFQVLLGGDGWAIELTQEEFGMFVELGGDLLTEFLLREDQMMPEEIISIEIERQNLWGCLEGKVSEWSMRFVLQPANQSSRGLEVSWSPPAAKAILLAMRTMWDSWQ